MLAKATLLSLFILLVWGNLVAGLKAGLACPDWPLCHGSVLPPIRFDIYMEFMHRVIGAVTSVLIIIFCVKRFRSYSGTFKLLPILNILLLILQIFLGGIVVLLKLPVDLTTIHFANAILIFSITLYLAYFDGKENKPSFSITGISGLFMFLSLLIFIQAVLGAYVRHSEAGLACPDFPTCLGYLIPPNLSGTVLTHFTHRILAYFLFFTLLVLLLLSKLNKKLNSVNGKIIYIFSLVTLQIVLGVIVVHTKLTFYVTALHLSIAILILSISLYTWFITINKIKIT